MTVAITTFTTTIPGDGFATSFSFAFPYVAAPYLEIVLTALDGSQAILSPSLYGLSLNPPVAGQLWGIGGTVTYPLVGAPIATGTALTITRILPLTQLRTISNQGAFYPNTVEAMSDYLTMVAQQETAAGVVNPPFNPANSIAFTGDNSFAGTTAFTGAVGFTGIASFRRLRVAVRVATDAGDVTVSAATDYFIAIDKTIGAPTSVFLPSSPVVGDTYLIKDLAGDAAVNNITVVPATGRIDGDTSFVIASNYQSNAFTYTGADVWAVN